MSYYSWLIALKIDLLTNASNTPALAASATHTGHPGMSGSVTFSALPLAAIISCSMRAIIADAINVITISGTNLRSINIPR